MAVYAFDGTWDDKENNTNVMKFYTTYNTNRPNSLNRYLTGVGTSVSLLGHLAGGVFGAATALDFANRVYKARLKNGSGQIVSPQIRFLGLWDAVAAFGVASLGFYFSQLNF